MDLTTTSFKLTYKSQVSDPGKAGRAFDEFLDGARTGDGRWTAKKDSVNFWEYSGNWDEDYSPYNIEIFADFLNEKYPGEAFEITGIWNSREHGGSKNFMIISDGKEITLKESKWHVSYFVSDIVEKYTSPEEFFRTELSGADAAVVSDLRMMCFDYKKTGKNTAFYVDCEGSRTPYFEMKYEE